MGAVGFRQRRGAVERTLSVPPLGSVPSCRPTPATRTDSSSGTRATRRSCRPGCVNDASDRTMLVTWSCRLGPNIISVVVTTDDAERMTKVIRDVAGVRALFGERGLGTVQNDGGDRPLGGATCRSLEREPGGTRAAVCCVRSDGRGLQELSMANGWSEEFVAVSSIFDRTRRGGVVVPRSEYSARQATVMSPVGASAVAVAGPGSPRAASRWSLTPLYFAGPKSPAARKVLAV